MVSLIIGNIIALIASLIMVYSGLIKEKKKYLVLQTTQIGLAAISNIVLGGITGAIINVISCIRNVICYKDKLNIPVKIVITIISAALCLIFNNMGSIGLFPLVSTVLYLWLMDIKDPTKFKILVVGTMMLWFAYDFYIKAYTASIFDALTIATNSIAISQIEKKKKKARKSKK